MHEVLVNHLGGLSVPRKSVVRLTGHPDMTLDVYHGCETTTQQQQIEDGSRKYNEELLAHCVILFLGHILSTLSVRKLLQSSR